MYSRFRYNNLGINVEQAGQLLVEMAHGLIQFFDTTQGLADWLVGAEEILGQFDPIAVYPDLLDDQCNALAVSVSVFRQIVTPQYVIADPSR